MPSAEVRATWTDRPGCRSDQHVQDRPTAPAAAVGCRSLAIPCGHPCRSADRSPYRAGSGLAPPSHPATTTCAGIAPVMALCAIAGAPRNKARCKRTSLPQNYQNLIRSEVNLQPYRCIRSRNNPRIRIMMFEFHRGTATQTFGQPKSPWS